MSGRKCKNCGSSEIEVDPARGDAVCTSCGTVLEDNIIVAEVEFQENAHGSSSAIGQFVSAETKGGATGFGGSFNVGIGQESRELTIRKARQGITALCQQLRLNQQCIDIACNFFKMALSRHLTKGRPASHIHAACVYITCRTEGTAHLLIDISDVLQICCYQLGRTYLRLSQALCINIPSIDPCLYILRFAARLQFGERTHEVSMTALRLVQRMKRDSIHSGRRPSGLCGAALLIAGRLHSFSRAPADVVRVVKVHESTLRKRLLEFGETPSSALTLEEFMTVDLEEEQDPPAFRAARRRDKERLQKLIEEEGGEVELTQLQKEIDKQLDKDYSKKKRSLNNRSSVCKLDERALEDAEAEKFAVQETLDLLGESLVDDPPAHKASFKKDNLERGLGPDLASMGLGLNEGEAKTPAPTASNSTDNFIKPNPKMSSFMKDLKNEADLILNEKDEADIDSLIMTAAEAAHKTSLWNKVNAGFLADQKLKEEQRAKEREEGKDKSKRRVRGNYKKRAQGGPANTAGEAIEKMLQEKRISTKINYDILKSLNKEGEDPKTNPNADEVGGEGGAAQSPAQKRRKPSSTLASPIVLTSPVKVAAKRTKKAKGSTTPAGLAVAQSPVRQAEKISIAPSPTPVRAQTESEKDVEDIDGADDYEEDADVEPTDAGNEMESLATMLRSNDDEDYFDYDEY